MSRSLKLAWAIPAGPARHLAQRQRSQNGWESEKVLRLGRAPALAARPARGGPQQSGGSMNATIEDFIDALGRLTEVERLGLLAVANTFAKRGVGFSCGKDLLSEVIYRVAEGKRHWPASAPLESFLVSSMRSVANAARRRAEASPGHRSLDDEDATFEACEALSSASTEQILIESQRRSTARDAIAFARRTLAGDRVALQVLEGICADLRASEMCEAFGINSALYHAARQRVMSRLTAYGRRHPQ
jgi:DNA-directed RNA polymerase specialized sigma24 family protein